jgi:DNA adenine methylase
MYDNGDGGTTVRPPIKWHGGKHYLAKRIIEHFPLHHTYVEPFGGAASVLLNKQPSPVEVYNDLDGRLTRFFRLLRHPNQELIKRLTLTPYSEQEFESASQWGARAARQDGIEKARRDFVLWRQSIGGRGDSFSYTLHRVRRGMADVVSGYLSAIDEVLPAVAERFRRVQILNRLAIDVIQMWDDSNTLFYCDPPYLHKTRSAGSEDVYEYEMSEDDHRDLAAVLQTCVGKVILSGYPSELYAELYGDWRSVVFDMPNHAAGGRSKARMAETLWMNWPAT